MGGRKSCADQEAARKVPRRFMRRVYTWLRKFARFRVEPHGMVWPQKGTKGTNYLRKEGVHASNGLCPKSLISLCNLCVLCVSVVVFTNNFFNHRGTEDAEMAQRRSPIRTFRARPL